MLTFSGTKDPPKSQYYECTGVHTLRKEHQGVKKLLDGSFEFSKHSHVLTPRSLVIALCVCTLRGARLFATPWTVAHQAPLSMGFSRQEYWSGLPFPSPTTVLGDVILKFILLGESKCPICHLRTREQQNKGFWLQPQPLPIEVLATYSVPKARFLCVFLLDLSFINHRDPWQFLHLLDGPRHPVHKAILNYTVKDRLPLMAPVIAPLIYSWRLGALFQQPWPPKAYLSHSGPTGPFHLRPWMSTESLVCARPKLPCSELPRHHTPCDDFTGTPRLLSRWVLAPKQTGLWTVVSYNLYFVSFQIKTWPLTFYVALAKLFTWIPLLRSCCFFLKRNPI